MRIPVPCLNARVSAERLTLAAFVCLLVVAAGLRFYDLPGNSVSHDEAAAANISRGALLEVVSGTRCCNSSPILYPLALWAAQKVESSPFSIRVLPAAASVLTVAVTLFLLPRLGVARGAAFLAALLATLSVEAIRHAQDAREYSIDALLAVLMTAGLLWYLRDGRRGLLCVALFLAPLLQYGLVLFGVAVMGAAVILPAPTLSASEGNSIRNWVERRIALVLPAACFMAGCAMSYAATLRYQWSKSDFTPNGYLSPYFYQGKFDARSIFEFSTDGIWSLLTYHLPEAVATAALAASALLLVAVLFRKIRGDWHGRAIAVLFSFCIAVSVGAAVLGIYPIGGIRQVFYLGPVVFLAVGLAFHWTVGWLASLMRLGVWTMPALLVIACGTALAGADDMRRDSPYKTRENIESVLAALKEQARDEDMVYAVWGAVPAIRFYLGEEERPHNYYYGTYWCTDPVVCLRQMADIAVSLPNVPNRIFLVHDDALIMEELEPLGDRLRVERVIADGEFSLYVIANVKESGEPAGSSDFDAQGGGVTLAFYQRGRGNFIGGVSPPP